MMNKIADFFGKWGFAVILGIVAVILLFTLGCCIYTAVVNPFVGIVGGIGAMLGLLAVAGLLYKEITEGR